MGEEQGLSAELKPCPFCGGAAEIERFGSPRQSTIYACTDCGCRLETGEEWGFGAGWNTRSEGLQPPVVEIGGEELGSLGASRAPSCGSLTGDATPSGLDADWFDEAEDFLDDYSDAEIIDGTTHPNKAMRLLCQLREARS